MVTRHPAAGSLLALSAFLTVPPPAHAQSGLRLGAGFGPIVGRHRDVPMEPNTNVSLGSGAIFVVDVILAVKCCNEWTLSGLLTPGISADRTPSPETQSVGQLAPMGLQLGLNHRWWHANRHSIWAGPFVGAFFSDRSDVGGTPPETLRFPTTWGYGARAAYRYRLTDSWSVEAGFRLQQTNDLAFDPYMVTIGVVTRLSNVP